MRTIVTSLALGVVVSILPSVSAQEKTVPAANAQRAAAQPVPLRVQLVVSRYQGEKKISSTPYTAPEVMQLMRLDARTDLFALGATIPLFLLRDWARRYAFAHHRVSPPPRAKTSSRIELLPKSSRLNARRSATLPRSSMAQTLVSSKISTSRGV